MRSLPSLWWELDCRVALLFLQNIEQQLIEILKLVYLNADFSPHL